MHSSLSRLLVVVVVVVVIGLAAVPCTHAAPPADDLPTFPSQSGWAAIMPASSLSGGSRPASLTYLNHGDDYPDPLSDDADSRRGENCRNRGARSQDVENEREGRAREEMKEGNEQMEEVAGEEEIRQGEPPGVPAQEERFSQRWTLDEAEQWAQNAYRIRKSILDDFTLRMLEAQQMYQQDLMMMHHLMQEQGYPLQGPYRYTPWPFPFFFPSSLPERGDGVHQHVAKKPFSTEKNSQSDEKSSDEYPEGPQSTEEESVELEFEDEPDDVFLDSPTPGPEWHIIPFLPPVPDADDLPDNYNNSTSTIHIVNGSIVQINSTTNKDTTDNVTTFLHTEVINILSDEHKENSSEEERGESTEVTLTSAEVTTQEPHPTEGTTDEEEKTEVESHERPTLEGETKNEFSEAGPSTHHVAPVKLLDPEVSGL